MGVTVELWHDDAETRLGEMPTGSVDLILTSPPIGIHVDARMKTERVEAPSPRWILEALRVSRGPVAFAVAPEFLDLATGLVRPDMLLVWMIDKWEAREQLAKGTFSADFNLIAVYRPRPLAKGVASSDVILAKPGLREPTHRVIEARKIGTADALATRYQHPAPGSVDLATKLARLWRPRVALDPFAGAGATLEGIWLAAEEWGGCTLFGIDINREYLDAIGHMFEVEFEARVYKHDGHPDPAKAVGR